MGRTVALVWTKSKLLQLDFKQCMRLHLSVTGWSSPQHCCRFFGPWRTEARIPMQCAEVSPASCVAGHSHILAHVVLMLCQSSDV